MTPHAGVKPKETEMNGHEKMKISKIIQRHTAKELVAIYKEFRDSDMNDYAHYLFQTAHKMNKEVKR